MVLKKADIINEMISIVGNEKVQTDPEILYHADGLLTRVFEKAFRYEPKYLPVCVVVAEDVNDISAVVKFCNENGISIIVKTGATCSEDQLLTINDHTVMVDASKLNKIIAIDAENMMATVQCGVPLAELEDQVRKLGLTTGHCPQSQPLAQMGGLVASRSIGQFSTYYGAIEDMVCGMEVVLNDGSAIRIRNVPRRAAGPDLRQIFIGSEGSLGIITEVTVKLFPYYPENFWMGAYIVDSFDTGLKAVQEIITKGFRPSVVRLYDKPDFDRNFGSIELSEDESIMFFLAEGPKDITDATGKNIHEISQKYGKYVGKEVVEHWMIHRNDCCDTMGTEEEAEEFRQTHVVYETVEISASWTEIRQVYADVMANVPKKIDNIVLLGGHVSHSYQTGTNIYFVYELKVQNPKEAYKEKWSLMKAICDEVIKQPTGGIVHHHGLGKLRNEMVHDELGTSYEVMDRLFKVMDPNNVFNPGNIIPVISQFDDNY